MRRRRWRRFFLSSARLRLELSLLLLELLLLQLLLLELLLLLQLLVAMHLALSTTTAPLTGSASRQHLIVRLRDFPFMFTAPALARGTSSALAGSALRHRLIAGLAFTLMFAAALSGSTLTR
jgi:hypothetical protein